MRPFHSKTLLLLLVSALAAGPAVAQKRDPAAANPTIDPVLVAAGFLDGHPDLRYRARGLDEYGRRNHTAAFEQFKRAAWYSDKPSQAIVAEMLWIGLGVPMDRALAYVWMDLAAERDYRSFKQKRDMYWRQLDEIERARAVREAPAIVAEYADAAAEPRLHAVLVRERRRATGSRLGSTTSPMSISVPGVGIIDSTAYYRPRYWEPEQYRAWQDSVWTDLRVIGTVDVGEVEQVGDPTPATSDPDPKGERPR